MPKKSIDISTFTQLNDIRNNLSGSYRLISNISMGERDHWEPIGTHAAPFIGSFDGNGYKITNMKVNAEDSYAGFFGKVENSILTNISLENITVSGRQAGGIAGFAHNTKVTNSYVTGDINSNTWNGEAYSGGIVGYLKGNGVIANCYSTGIINSSNHEGRSYSGGIAGYLGDDGFSYGEGITKPINDSSVIANSYSTSAICSETSKGDSFSGGIAGYMHGNSSITGCAAINHYILADTSHNYGATRVGSIVGCSKDLSTIISNNFMLKPIPDSNPHYPIIERYSTDNTEIKLKATYQSLEWDFENIWAIDDGYGLPLLKHQPKIIKIVIDNIVHENSINNNIFIIPATLTDVRFIEWNLQADGKGKRFTTGESINVSAGFTIYAVMKGITAEYPYEVYTDSDLNRIRDNLSWHCKLMSNISLSEYSDNEGWEPIGTKNDPFTGSLDGNGHVISNLYINSTNEHIGLFGYIREGSIYNLGIEVAEGGVNKKRGGNSSRSHAGGIAGCLYDGKIKNCYITGNITALEGTAGGITGEACNSTIKNCYSIVNITAKSCSGGIVGVFRSYSPRTDDTISSCYTVGNITSTFNDNSGGVAGHVTGGKITNSHSVGGITSDDYSQTGGIVGYMSGGTITNCAAVNFIINPEADARSIIKSILRKLGNDDDNPWKIPVDGGYPILFWQNGS